MTLPILFARFLGVGACGFAIDAIIFQLLFNAGGGLVVPRLISASVSITLTWYLNRRLVFRTHEVSAKGPEYGRYLGVQAIGLLVNFAAYFLALAAFEPLRAVPVAAIAIGAAAALVFNFAGARWWAFQMRQQC